MLKIIVSIFNALCVDEALVYPALSMLIVSLLVIDHYYIIVTVHTALHSGMVTQECRAFPELSFCLLGASDCLASPNSPSDFSQMRVS